MGPPITAEVIGHWPITLGLQVIGHWPITLGLQCFNMVSEQLKICFMCAV